MRCMFKDVVGNEILANNLTHRTKEPITTADAQISQRLHI